jgi:hypothetical protein
MRFAKYIFTIIFIFLSALLYSQELEPGDINILYNGLEELSGMLDPARISGNIILSDYSDRAMEIYRLFFDNYHYEGQLTDDEFDRIKRQYQRFMEIDVPVEIEKVFRSIGWDTNGHKKLWTLLFGASLLGMIHTEEDFANSRLINLFHENDIVIVEKWLKENNFY